jgi:NADH:ubiquinone reductase (non-electrogenic)
MVSSKQSILIIGSGWAGATLSDGLDESKFSITVVSPETTTPYTPLLASAACGLYDFSIVETPIRHTKRHIKFIKARVEAIDFKSKTVKCTPTFLDLPVKEFSLDYDVIAIAPGVRCFCNIDEMLADGASAQTKHLAHRVWPKTLSSSAT